jgi:hypothetical protein
MKIRFRHRGPACLAAAALLLSAAPARAQITPAAGYTPPDDTPKINVGVTIFADYTYQDTPLGKDSAGNSIHINSFNVSRAYINVTGNLSHWFSFRITPDIARETGTSSLAGSQLYRLKYAFGQVNFDDFAPKGSWFRFGLQQTPWIDYDESVYRYRFQGPTFTDVETILISSDYGASAHFNFPDNYGDIHAGFYNGDGYGSTADQRGINSEKAFQIRGTLRPMPGMDVLKGLRVAGFYDIDHYVPGAKRERVLGNATFENPYVNAGFEYLDAHDMPTITSPNLHRDGFSVWATPRTPMGIEALIRYDYLNQDTSLSPHPQKKRLVAGLAYWPALHGGKTVSFMVDYSEVKLENQPNPANNGSTKIWALHTLWNF